MIRLGNDYSHGAHPDIMQRLLEENMKGYPGYGYDSLTSRAIDRIQKICDNRNLSIHFLTGGTQTNLVAIDYLLRNGEGVLCSPSAHINVHEAGAIELTGHKVITIPEKDGKISAGDVRRYMQNLYKDETWPHIVQPGMVYISQPTEYGSLYSLEELEELRSVCDEFHLSLYADGARLIYALASPENEVSLNDLSRLCDAFYIGGTKCGTLFGEALVICKELNDREEKRLFGLIKRHGALLAKGWSVALQFDELFSNDLFQRLGHNAISLAYSLREGLGNMGVNTCVLSCTNQQFFLLPDSILDSLSEEIAFDIIGPRGEELSVVRLVTDWSTKPEDIPECVRIISRHINGTGA